MGVWSSNSPWGKVIDKHHLNHWLLLSILNVPDPSHTWWTFMSIRNGQSSLVFWNSYDCTLHIRNKIVYQTFIYCASNISSCILKRKKLPHHLFTLHSHCTNMYSNFVPVCTIPMHQYVISLCTNMYSHYIPVYIVTVHQYV